jgi:hypothetical protein
VNNFVIELWDDECEACTFYTVKYDDAENSETAKFYDKFENSEEFEDALNELTEYWVGVIGTHGALDELLRPEDKAHAIPQSGEHQVDEVTISYSQFPLRLYCLKINESILILFNGDEKTSDAALDGKTRTAFREAQAFSKRILDGMKGELIIIEDEVKLISTDGDEMYL